MSSFIDAGKAEFGVEPICRELKSAGIKIAPSTYYARRTRPPSRRAARDAELDERIARVHAENFGVCGVRKIWKTLNRLDPDQPVARCTVARRMQALGLYGVPQSRTTRTTRPAPAATARPEDLLRRDFTASAPNQRWVADIT